MRSAAPETRCAVLRRSNGLTYLFVVLPRPPPPRRDPVEALPPLMIFDDAATPPPPLQNSASSTTADERYTAGSTWESGSVVVPLYVDEHGVLCRADDLGTTEFESLQEVRDKCGPFESFTEYPAFFGALLLDRLYILVATQVLRVASLPFAGRISRVLQTRWLPFDIPNVAPPRVSLSDRARLAELEAYSYEKGYYYSDDADLRLPFPFAVSTDTSDGVVPDLRCDWSAHLRPVFSDAALERACSVLIRGFAEERVAEMRDDTALHVLLIGRQNCLNPGPRYLSRGLNATNGVGNDHFYEYIMWRVLPARSQSSPPPPPGRAHERCAQSGHETVLFTRHVLLRGTIPVHWTTQLGVSLSEPTMTFSARKEEVVSGSDVYFLRTFRDLQRLMRLDTHDTTTLQPYLCCINLLRQNPQNGEDALARNFHLAVKYAEPRVKAEFAHGKLDLVHVDWLRLVKDYGVDVATSTFWEAALGFLAQSRTPAESMMTVGAIHADGTVDRLLTQSRFLRINCADSLDRTNLACFFTCLQVSIVMLLTLQISFDTFRDQCPLAPLDASADDAEADGAYNAAFAPVACAKHTVPAPFINTWSEARDPGKLPACIARLLAELYVENGDTVAMLYTNSAAMHGNLLRDLCGMRRTAHNAVIATQRRFENAFEDGNKFRNIELLLGRNINIHLPSISPVFLTRPVAYTKWTSALLVVGVPTCSTPGDIETALRRLWDNVVVPRLQRQGVQAVCGDALRTNVTMQRTEAESSDLALAVEADKWSVKKRHAGNAAGTPSSTIDLTLQERSERIVVIELHGNFCGQVDASSLVRHEGYLTICERNCVVAPYGYPIQLNEEAANGGMGGAVKNVGSSLKRGFKNFVRNLN